MQVYGLIGNPVGHSLSPTIHEAAYAAQGVDARYVVFEPSRESAGEAVRAADALNVAGLNVTIPFKEAVCEHVSTDELASRVGAVNTITFESDPPRGYNTDVYGAKRALTEHDVMLGDARIVLVGAGGAARAIAAGLADAGAEVHIANRTFERATEVADLVGTGHAYSLDALSELVPEADVLVNATSVGMESGDTPVPAELLHDSLTVMDVVYSPLETTLLSDAAAVGANTIDGAWMLLYQAAKAYELWTGRSAPTDAMNRALRNAL